VCVQLILEDEADLGLPWFRELAPTLLAL